MPNNENSLFTETAGETFATKAAWRRKKAEEQPRDANGRWIADGARITYKDELSGNRVAATVVSTANGDAVVERDNPDGTTTKQTVPNNTVEVVSSKARIPKDGTTLYDKNNNFDPIINSKKFKDSLKANGQAVISREDGYQLEASSDAEAGDPRDDKKNPIAYQLFAPGGKSLGSYTSKAAASFNDMVDDDKSGGTEEDTTPPAADEPAETLFSNATVIRVSRDGSLAILKDGEGNYRPLTLSNMAVGSASPDLPSVLSQSRGWRRPVEGELDSARPLFTLDTSNSITASASKITPYRIPAAIKSEISSALSSMDTSQIPARDLEVISSLATNEAVSIEEVRWINNFLSTHEESKKFAGGQKGEKWASKILSGFEDNAKHDFASDKLAYYAVGDGNNGWAVSDILAVDFTTDEVYSWTNEGFELSDKTIDSVEAPILLPIDEFSAEELSTWIDNGRKGEVFNLADVDPVERNLVELALSELDLDELSDIGAIVASGGAVVDVDGYTPAERSQNAKNQPRAGGGKFGTKRSDAPMPQEKEVKARLEQELPFIDPAARIVEWLATAPVTAAGAPQEAPVAEEAAPATEAPAEAETPVAEEESADTGESKSLYFAIVDEVDKTSVLDAIAITKNDLGEPEAWKRMGADWVPAPEILAQFNGTTPPPVVELEVPEPAKAILSQVDSHDAERGTGEDPAPAPAEAAPVAETLPIAASSGFALNNGQWSIFSLTDLTNAIDMLPLVNEATRPALKQHLRKRAFAMNRMDLIPAEWRTATLAERGEQFLNTSPLFGEHGEVLIAAGVPGIADTPSDWAAVMRLQNYWTRGKGAAKIRWGTPGDLTRAHRHLAKYVGPQRAWGLAQKFHKAVFGVYNHTHDVATGQYKPRRKKRR